MSSPTYWRFKGHAHVYYFVEGQFDLISLIQSHQRNEAIIRAVYINREHDDNYQTPGYYYVGLPSHQDGKVGIIRPYLPTSRTVLDDACDACSTLTPRSGSILPADEVEEWYAQLQKEYPCIKNNKLFQRKILSHNLLLIVYHFPEEEKAFTVPFITQGLLANHFRQLVPEEPS